MSIVKINFIRLGKLVKGPIRTGIRISQKFVLDDNELAKRPTSRLIDISPEDSEGQHFTIDLSILPLLPVLRYTVYLIYYIFQKFIIKH